MTSTRKGFTLIELLTVMGVMIIITSIVVANAFGVSKGAAYASAREIPFNVLQYAHQRACMDGRVTAACFFLEGDEMCVSLFQVAGRVSVDSKTEKITDYYSDIAEMGVNEDTGEWDKDEGRRLGSGMLRVFNFENGKGFIANAVKRRHNLNTFRRIDDTTADGNPNQYCCEVTEIYPEKESKWVPASRWNFNAGDWKKGNQYGFEVSERIALPKDFTFKADGGHKSGDDFWLFFNPDGTSDTVTINVADIKGTSAAFRIKVENGSVSLVDK